MHIQHSKEPLTTLRKDKEKSSLLKAFNKPSMTQLPQQMWAVINTRQQWLANITCYKCGQKDLYRKDCPKSACTSPGPYQKMLMQPYSPPTTVTQMVTAT